MRITGTLSVAGLEACLHQVSTKDDPNQRFFTRGEVLENEIILLDLPRAEELILRLNSAYIQRTHMFERVRAETHGPHFTYYPGYEVERFQARGMDCLPGISPSHSVVLKKGSLEHILFLFFATLTDRRQKSGGDFGVYASHCAIYAKHPELYTEAVISWEEDKLAKLLSTYRIGVPNQSAKYWIQCAKTVFQEYGGDPVRMYKEHGGTVAGILKFRDSKKKEGSNPLPGYGPKIASLYSLFLDAFGALPFPLDAFPVDVQVQRLFIQHEAIKGKVPISNSVMEKTLRPLICLLAKFHHLNKQDISHSFWLLGSEGCNACSKKQNAPKMCPIYADCRGGENTAGYFAKGAWDPKNEPMQKGASKVRFGMLDTTSRPTRVGGRNQTPTKQIHLFALQEAT